jgi:hypothetical protein
MPDKKWYILVDDDTYIMQSSMERFLGHLDSTLVHFLGNGVGALKDRFAHGGSSMIFSAAALRQLFSNHEVISAAYHEGLVDPLGDHLLSVTVRKAGIYLEEEYSHLFNGEPPANTKIRRDRFCTPVLTFHNLKSPADMRQTIKHFGFLRHLVRWVDVWSIMNAPSFDSFQRKPMREEWDHVGRLDEHTTTLKEIESPELCLSQCQRRQHSCLAWTWELDTGHCNMSPWIIVGKSTNNRTTGLNLPEVMALSSRCRTS